MSRPFHRSHATAPPHRSSKRRTRAIVGLVLTALAVTAALLLTRSADTGRVFRIAPNGKAGADGSSWMNAGTLRDLPRFVQVAEPGDEVWIRGDAGTYRTTGAITISAGGAPGTPVVVRGVSADGSEGATPTFVGTRTAPYRPGGNPGTELFRLIAGANNLEFHNLAFVNQGNGAFRVGANISNLTIRDMRATNVRRFLENLASGNERSATINGLSISNVTVNGFSKGVIHLRDNSNNVVIRDVVGDSQRQDGDRFAMGIHLEGTVHDVLLERVTMRNSHDTVSGPYWNGDGFASEAATYNLQFVDTVATGSTDSGYDLKSKSTTLLRAVAEDNNRNYRFWGQADVIDSIGRNPNHRGGTGGQAQLWAGWNAKVHVINSTFTDNRNNVAFLVDDTADVTLQGTSVTPAFDGKQARVAKGARLQWQ